MTIIGANLGRINTTKIRTYLNSKQLGVMSMMVILRILIAVKDVQSNSIESGFD